MKRWLQILGGLLIWAAHFLAVYAAASIFPGEAVANILALAATFAALGADGTLLWFTLGRVRMASDTFDRWIWRLGAASAALSLVAVIWQGTPALSFPQ